MALITSPVEEGFSLIARFNHSSCSLMLDTSETLLGLGRFQPALS